MICSEVPNIAAVCKAEDTIEMLSMHNDSTIIKKIGVGLSSSISETEQIEFNFYNNFGLETEFSLLTNFKDHLGKSNKTLYDWSTAPKSTWQNEQNVTIEIETSTKCETKIFEIVGKCSYLNVRPLHLVREDNCSGSILTTTEMIPHNIHRRSYKSEVPYMVKNRIN